jgi:hypothetical protein
MRMILFLVSFFLVAVPTASAQNSPWAQKIFLGVTNHEFGNCPRGAQLKHRFVMRNIYAVPLEITGIRSSCGCLTYTPSTMKLQPQEEGYIDINMDGRKFTGPKAIQLYITVGPQYISTAVIQVTANARADVVFNPGEVDFGVVSVGSRVTRSIDVEYAGNLDWRINEVVKNKNSPFQVVPTETYRQPSRIFQTGKVGYRLDITLDPSAPPGPIHQEIILKTNDPASPVLSVSVEGTIQASLTALPSNIKLGTLRIGQATTRKILISGNQPFQITRLTGTDKDLVVPIPGQITNVQTLNLQIQPTQPGEFRKNLIVTTNLGGGESVTITIEGTVK